MSDLQERSTLQRVGAVTTSGLLPPQLFLESVEQAPIAISITDPAATILYVNTAFERLTGYQRDEVIGLNQSILSSHSTPVAIYHELWRTIQQQQVWRGTLVNHRKGGGEYLAELSVSPVLDEQGAIAYYLGMHRDISELHALQQRLAFQNSLTDAALAAAPMVVVMISCEGERLFDNAAYQALCRDFGAVHEPLPLILNALQQQIGFELQPHSSAGERFTNVEIRLDPPHRHEPRWFSCSGVRIADFDPAARSFFQSSDRKRCGLLLVANEVTSSRKRLQEARLNMIRANMAEQQMVQSMREAISAAIFKLQAPINIIKAALAMSGSGDRSTLQPVLRQALAAGEEAIETLHQGLPRIQPEQTTALNINELIDEVLHLVTDQLLANGIVVDWRVAPQLPTLRGRPNALRSLFKYLIENAIEALREAGRDYREIRLETHLADDEVVVALMDNGIGIPEAQRIRVFEPFYCGWQNPRDHAGMGLTMAQEVTLNHRGSITIDRHFLGGCRIFIHLPCVQAIGGDDEPF